MRERQFRKADLRAHILNFLKNHKEEDRIEKSLAIEAKLFQTPEFQNAHTILFYASFNGEVDTFQMMKHAQAQGKQIGLPRINCQKYEIVPQGIQSLTDDLEKGPFGILQPKADLSQGMDVQEIDLVIVPGLAFDKSNHRLGRGGGYYDRFLKRLPPRVVTLGLAFDFQIVDSLPQIDDGDMPVFGVLSN